ncbi:MAG TPA: hypothetical protein VGF94_09745 [Kofleriaceae bacterium]
MEFLNMHEWTRLGAALADLNPEKYDEIIKALRKIVDYSRVLALYTANGSMPRRLMNGSGERIEA